MSDTGLVRSVSGDPSLTFDVTLSQPAPKAVTVDYETRDDWQPFVLPGDAHGVSTPQSTGQYVSLSPQVVQIPKGKSEKTVTITTLPYGSASVPLWFTVILSNPVGATLEDAYGTATLLPAATTPGFSVGIGDTSIRAPASGSETADMTVAFSGPAPKKFTLTATTTSPATADFTPVKESITVPAKALSATVPITVLANPANKSSATVSVALTTTQGTVNRPVGTLEVRGQGMTTSRSGRLPGPPRLALVGDSITAAYTDYLKPVLEAEGYAVMEDGVPGAGLLDANECNGALASNIVASQDPDTVVWDSFGNFNGFPPCNPSLVADSPAWVAAWQTAAVTDSTVMTAKGASLYWVIGAASPLAPWTNRILQGNSDYLAIAAHTPNVYAIDMYTAFGGATPNLSLRYADRLHLSPAGDQLVTSVIVHSIPATLPSAPIGVSATAGNGSAVVSWGVPASNGSPITGYTVSAIDTTNSARGGQKVTGPSSPLTVPGLTNGDSYVFTVSATNGKGTGPLGVFWSLVVPTTVPDAPTGVTATPGNGSASVAWTAPSANGSPITAYTVTAADATTPANGGQTVTGTANPVTLTGLTNGDSYTFTVTATNARGTGVPSVPSPSTVPTTVPGAPTGVTATPGNGSASVAWTAPSANGSPITAYTVTAADATTPANGGQTVTGTANPVTLTGLTNGDSYTFTVTATNRVGTGAASTPSPPVSLPTVPDAPSGVLATADPANDPGTLQVYFFAGYNEGSPVTGYTATVTDLSNAGDPTNGDTVSGSASPITVRGLTLGDLYSFTVTATNALGTSQAAAPSVGTAAPAAVPGPPTGVVAVPGSGSALVGWTAPPANGSPITGYAVIATDSTNPANGGQTVSVMGTVADLTGLTNGDVDTFTVTATNAVGTGPASLSSGGVVPAAPPDPPMSVTAVPDLANDPGILVVSFTPGFAEGSPVSGYTVTVSDLTNPNDPNQDATVTGPGSPITVTGLTSGDTYSFVVTATNAAGTGIASAPSAGAMPP